WQQMAGLLARAALYVGPDTSTTHLAAAVGVPIVSVFGPTNPLRWAPLGHDAPATGRRPAFARYSEQTQRRGRVILLQGPGACVPCGRAGCEDRNESHSACLEAIGAQRVIDAIESVLEQCPLVVAA
ncbi:MAG: LPS core biosynthesis protein, partial [Pseudomonadota bacterium]|nr:LPS core biosynthesis protein [Pseudomonadota bacterium]